MPPLLLDPTIASFVRLATYSESIFFTPVGTTTVCGEFDKDVMSHLLYWVLYHLIYTQYAFGLRVEYILHLSRPCISPYRRMFVDILNTPDTQTRGLHELDIIDLI